MALKEMLEEQWINSEIYARALDEGWSVQETMEKRDQVILYDRVAREATSLYHNQGFEAMMYYVAKQGLSELELASLCNELGLSHVRVEKWLRGYQTFIDSSPAAAEVLKLFERREGNVYTGL